MKSLKSGLVVSLAVLLSAACTVTETTNTNTNRNSSAPVAATPANTNAASTNSNTSANSNTSGAATTLDAAALFNNDTAPKCASCHRADGKGVEPMKASMKDLPDFTNAAWQKKATDAEMIETIKNGHKPMPAYKDKLTEDQIKALVAYVRKFGS
ncbi:MAG TPA: c-type cytochrome [Blastocatellia bacterium]|nr:c-type cytochrome [Blastocatellia bacterium]